MNLALLDAPRWKTSWSSSSAFDRAGLAAIAVLGIWPLLTGGWRVTALVVACVGAFGVGRFQGSSNAWIVPAFLVFGLAMVAAADIGGLFSDSPVRGPLGYSNAKAALFVQGAVAAAMLAMTAGSMTVRRLALVAAVAFSTVPLVSGTVMASLTLVLVGASFVAPRRWARPAITGFMAVFVAALVATTAIGIAGGFSGASGGERRVTLWGEAVDLMAANYVLGAGERGFDELSPTAVSDADASWAHNEFLQLGAEHGVPALAAAVFLILWLLAWLRRGEVMSTLALPAGAAVAALSVQATFDYVGHFALIPMFCAALVGTALGVAETRTTGSRAGRPSRSTPA